MVFIPEIRLCLCNAGLVIVPAWFAGLMISFFYKKGFKRASDISWYTKKDKVASFSSMFFLFAFMIYSICVPCKTGTPWFYAGLSLSILGCAVYLMALVSFASAPHGETIRSGIYRVSRNPMYFSFSLMMLGATLASLSGILLILWALSVAAMHMIILGEERYCLKKYSESYREYTNKVPRYFFTRHRFIKR